MVWLNAAPMRAAGFEFLRSQFGIYFTEGFGGTNQPSFVLEVRERSTDRLFYPCVHIDSTTWEAIKACQIRALDDAMVE